MQADRDLQRPKDEGAAGGLPLLLLKYDLLSGQRCDLLSGRYPWKSAYQGEDPVFPQDDGGKTLYCGDDLWESSCTADSTFCFQG